MRQIGWAMLWLWIGAEAGLGGCGGENSISLSLPDGNTLQSGGSLRIVARVTDNGGSPADGSSLTWATTKGSFLQTGSGCTDAQRSIQTTLAGDQTEVKLFWYPGETGEATVTARFLASNDSTVTAEIKVTLQGGSAKVSGKTFRASCDAKNISVYASSSERSAMRVRCVVKALDRLGNPIPNADILWRVENNCKIEPATEIGSCDRVFALTPNCDPEDVEPITGEPKHIEAGVTHNPRDGLLTLIFIAEGEEGYDDANQNGKYDSGESFVGYDLPEPYVDVDDNGEYDTGEPFVDLNSNGAWDPANGRWDGSSKIWWPVRILFSGPPDESPDTTRYSGSIKLDNGGTQQLTLTLTDINVNPIAANDSGDNIAFELTTAGSVNLVGSSQPALAKSLGMEFTAEGPGGKINAASFTKHRTVSFNLQDGDPSVDLSTQARVDATVTWTPAPGYDTYSPTQQDQKLSAVTGTAR